MGGAEFEFRKFAKDELELPEAEVLQSSRRSPHRTPCTASHAIRQAAARWRFRSATTARMSSQSMSLKLCIGQYFGPHIEQNSADLK